MVSLFTEYIRRSILQEMLKSEKFNEIFGVNMSYKSIKLQRYEIYFYILWTENDVA
jgi:hypothetical protein